MRFSLFSTIPRITVEDDTLVARTSIPGWLLTLTLLHREVRFAPDRKRVTVDRTLCWFFRKQTQVRFSQIQSISYTYEDWNMSTSLGYSGHTRDCFSVGLNLSGNRHLHLFRFLGAGNFIDNSRFPDWMGWSEHRFDITGIQGEASKAFVEVLETMLKVPIVSMS